MSRPKDFQSLVQKQLDKRTLQLAAGMVGAARRVTARGEQEQLPELAACFHEDLHTLLLSRRQGVYAMRIRKPYIAELNQVRICRQGEHGVIEYLEPNVSTTYLRIGPEVQSMSDKDILDKHNEILRLQQQMALEYQHVAIEIPPGHPQIEYQRLADQWTPRGHVVRCVIDDAGPDGEAVIYIDDQELSLREFGRLLTTFAGWGMRIVFVPDDETGDEPDIEVREPDAENAHGTSER